jgi:hypothetical protein
VATAATQACCDCIEIGGGDSIHEVEQEGGGGNGAPLRAGGTGSPGIRAASAFAGRDPRLLRRHLPVRRPRGLAHLR